MKTLNPDQKIFLGIDLDGTLLTPCKKIAHQSFETLRKFKNLYPKAVLAFITGRSFTSAKKYVELVNKQLDKTTIAYLACFNGSVIYKVEESGGYTLLDKHLVLDKMAEKIWHSCRKHKVFFWGYPQEPYKGAPCMVGRHPLGHIIQMLRWKDMHYLKGYINNNYFKINVMMFFSKRLDHFVKNFTKHDLDQVELIRANNRLIEITAHGINKGTAVNFICNREQIPVLSRCAIGDSGNDLAMFKEVTFKAAICGSPQRLIDASTYVGTTKNHRRFSSIFENYFLKLKGN